MIVLEDSKEIKKMEQIEEKKEESDGSCDFSMQEIHENTSIFGNILE